MLQRNDVLSNMLPLENEEILTEGCPFILSSVRKTINRVAECLFLNNLLAITIGISILKLNCLLIAILLACFPRFANAQAGLCPPNLDFEQGDFTNWNLFTGTATTTPIVWTPVATPVVPRHTIISRLTSGTDPYGGFPESCPNGSAFCVRLGNNQSGRQAERITYTYSIPATVSTFSMIFNYAVVLQNPNHTIPEQPRFTAKITDVSTGLSIPCVDFDFAATASLPGFRHSAIDPSVIYKGWTPITINLSAYIGRTIQLEFTANGCTLGAHFGYAYVDVNTNCNGAIAGTTICQGDNSITLTAPFGFESYEWYADNTFTTLLATTQNLPLNPAPAVGTIIPVIVNPYPGFGCKDTLYATITVSPKPVSVAGPDVNLCKYQAATLGGPATAGYTYSWTPVSQVDDPFISNPTGTGTLPGPTEFIVKTTDILTGCFSYDTTYIYNKVVDTAIRLSGRYEFCDYGIPEATLTVNNTSSPIQWYNGGTLLAGVTSASYQPLVSGNYWAAVTQNGCTDSTAAIAVAVHPLPVSSFAPDEDTLCVTNNSFVFRNSSAVPDNSLLSYNWKFSNGTTQQTTDATIHFTAVGIYRAELVATSEFGCKDSTHSDVYVLPNGVPNFTWDSICMNRPTKFTNLSNENGSALVKYNWSFNNGGPGSVVRDPLPVMYTTPGKADVTLEMTTLGCETDPKKIVLQVQANPSHKPVRYRDITVPQNSSQFIHVRDTVGKIFNWTPAIQLSKYNARYTEFFATGDDVKYLVEITDEHTCVTTDTILMQVLKKPGYYLPTAFTPNADGLNDVAIPYLVGMKGLKSFSVFNRWGIRIFYSEKEGEGWDGKSKGVPQDSGVYVWLLEFYDSRNEVRTEKGTITIIR